MGEQARNRIHPWLGKSTGDGHRSTCLTPRPAHGTLDRRRDGALGPAFQAPLAPKQGWSRCKPTLVQPISQGQTFQYLGTEPLLGADRPSPRSQYRVVSCFQASSGPFYGGCHLLWILTLLLRPIAAPRYIPAIYWEKKQGPAVEADLSVLEIPRLCFSPSQAPPPPTLCMYRRHPANWSTAPTRAPAYTNASSASTSVRGMQGRGLPATSARRKLRVDRTGATSKSFQVPLSLWRAGLLVAKIITGRPSTASNAAISPQ